MTYLEGRTSANLPNSLTYLDELDEKYGGHLAELLSTPEGRRELTWDDPLLFALVYLRHIITNKFGKVTFADFHLGLCRQAYTWIEPLASEEGPRDVFVMSRNGGKSAWLMRILPLWAAAHKHSSKAPGLAPFIVLLSQSNLAVSAHYGDIHEELMENDLLQQDFPEMYQSAPHPRADYAAENGLLIVATSIESKLRGLNIRNRRPDIIVIDDIDPDHASQAVVDGIVDGIGRKIQGLATDARMVIAGTTAQYFGVIHQLLMREFDPRDIIPKEVLEWTDPWTVHYYEPIVTEDGEERSSWPGKWRLPYLRKIRDKSPKVWQLEWLNRPAPLEGAVYRPEHYVYADKIDDVVQRIAFIDVTNSTNAGSDSTGIIIGEVSGAAVRCNASGGSTNPNPDAKIRIVEAYAVKMTGFDLVDHHLQVNLPRYPGLITLVGVTGAQDWIKAPFAAVPNVGWVNESNNKEMRIYEAFPYTAMGNVVYDEKLKQGVLQQQQLAFSGKGSLLHDDVIDPLSWFVLHYFKPELIKVQRQNVGRPAANAVRRVQPRRR